MAKLLVYLKEVFLVFIFYFGTINSMPLVRYSKPTNSLFEALDFLHNYGYLDMSSNNLLDQAHIAKAIKSMQNFAGLKETGVIDEETKNLMNSERCGLPDVQSRRVKRYVIHKTKWPRKVLTWRIYNYGNDGIPKSVIRRSFKRSLEKWSNHTNLKFSQIHEGEPDIWFKFAVGKHGDSSPFKRPWDGVIAHAYYPNHGAKGISGDIHFNDDKNFSVNSYKGKNLPWVALHEIGHSIGMEHSKVKDAIMFPYYKHYNGHESLLSKDDIAGVQALYGKKNKIEPLATAKPPAKKCVQKITAAFTGTNKLTYFFSNNLVLVLNKNLQVILGPIRIGKIFKGVKSVDAAFRRQDGNTVLFSKQSFYVFSPKNSYLSGPNSVSSSFPGLDVFPGKVDAAFVWSRINALYITKGSLYWRYFQLAESNGYGLVPGYPKLLKKRSSRLTGNINAALTWTDGSTYLFKGEKYYKLGEKFQVLKGYPKQTSIDWGELPSCDSKNDGVTEEKNSAVATEMTMARILVMVLTVLSFTFIH